MHHSCVGRDNEVDMIEAEIVGKKLGKSRQVQLARGRRLREDVDFAFEISLFDGAEQCARLSGASHADLTDYQAIDIELNVGRRVSRGQAEVTNRYFAEKRRLDLANHRFEMVFLRGP